MTLRRFAPVWVLYTVGILLYTSLSLNTPAYYADYLYDSMRFFSTVTVVFNFGYAFLLAQLLFGDLYTPRLCYAIHSFPVTRGGWFGTQIILGILGSLIPNLLAAAIMVPALPKFPIIALWIFAANELQFLFFFGAAVLCAICAGNRLGMATLYAILNCIGISFAWFRVKLFSSLIYALWLPTVRVHSSPLQDMATNRIYDTETIYIAPDPQNPDAPCGNFVTDVTLTGYLWWILIYALVGCFFLYLAMRLYRKRKLECAGDLLAFPKLAPLVLVLFTIAAGSVFHVGSFALYGTMSYAMLAIGLVLGYYICLMLLKRQINVFTLRSTLPLAAICGAFLIAITLTGLDAFGITYRMPKAEDVASVSVHMNYSSNDTWVASTPEEINKVLSIHEAALESHRQAEASRPLLERIYGNEDVHDVYTETYREDGTEEYTSLVFLTYTLKNGSQLNRCYRISESNPGVPILKEVYSRKEYVIPVGNYNLFHEDDTMEDVLDRIQMIQLDCFHKSDEFNRNYTNISERADHEALLNAILADCEAGNAVQDHFFHGNDWGKGYDCLQIWYHNPDSRETYNYSFYLFSDCTNTFTWLNENGYHTPHKAE